MQLFLSIAAIVLGLGGFWFMWSTADHVGILVGCAIGTLATVAVDQAWRAWRRRSVPRRHALSD